MIHFKNLKNSSPGFSFMEIIIAVLMLGMLMTAIFTLQNTTFRSVVDFSARLAHIFSLKNKLVTASRDRAQQTESQTKPLDELTKESTKIIYTLEKVNEKSALKKFENVMIEKAVAQWQEGTKKYQEILISFFYKVPEKKESGKK